MKRFSVILMCFVAIALGSCGSSSGVANTNPVAVTAGTGCAQALIGLYNSYKANGNKLDLTNASNITNALAVAGAYSNLKSNKEDATYKKSFTNGMVAGGKGLITTAGASTLLNTLLSSTGLEGLNTSNISQKAETVTSIITLLNALK
ncbi:MAG: hypothetical protein IJV22_01125 [Bacteroidales bacterium]|nr:hypothetical protein [Bacteroidales bacterium]